MTATGFELGTTVGRAARAILRRFLLAAAAAAAAAAEAVGAIGAAAPSVAPTGTAGADGAAAVPGEVAEAGPVGVGVAAEGGRGGDAFGLTHVVSRFELYQYLQKQRSERAH